MSEHEEMESSVAAWVLGALDAETAARVQAHVDSCPECQATYARLAAAAGAISLAGAEVNPPLGLRARILAAAAASPQTAVAAAGERAPIVSLRSPARRRSAPPFGRVPMAGLAAAVAVALLAGGLVGRLTTPPPAAAVARFNLAGHASMQGVTAGVVDLKREGLAVVTFSHLPAPPAGMVYELWLITPGGRADPAGVFAPDAAGARSVVVDRSLAGYSLMAVTVETGPDGALSPSQAPQIYGNIV